MWLFGRAPVARFRRRARLGCAPNAFWFNGLTLRPFLCFHQFRWLERVVRWLFFLCMRDVTEQTAMSNLCHHHHLAATIPLNLKDLLKPAGGLFYFLEPRGERVRIL